MINIHFNNRNRNYLAHLPQNFNMNDLQQLIIRYFKNPFRHRFVISGKELGLLNNESFAHYQSLFHNGVNILVLERMLGGGYVEIEILTNIILYDLEQALQQIVTINDPDRPCQVCRESTHTMKLCCNRICKVCFGNYFAFSNFQLKCMTCHENLPYDRFFLTSDFIRCLESLTDIYELMRNIDCQICRCGSLVVNETLYSQQTCTYCQRTFCFFCNKDWNEGLLVRNNNQYYCNSNCDYITKLSYELVPLECNKNVLVPNRRFCPFCFALGSYDKKCKYHTCPVCLRSFCFICLEEEETCKTKYESNYQHKCTDVKKQNYSDFPTIIKHS
ncbi:unnamed protein product [Rotaria socialis]|uniref:Uncharacterized protein n=1 Tax=Rotaria socialis TaxID=392032 RepID=A0A818Y311_9BILA|nr:unnamed protein product [Rotaria socialis]CAF4861560.1 unnamed protein product [Rotaria socialis]